MKRKINWPGFMMSEVPLPPGVTKEEAIKRMKEAADKLGWDLEVKEVKKDKPTKLVLKRREV